MYGHPEGEGRRPTPWVVLPPTEGREGRVDRWRWLAVAAALLGVSAILFLSRSGGGGPSPAAVEAPAATVSPAAGPSALAVPADSLGASLEVYAHRDDDFQRGRIDCASLTTGYARVSEWIVALAQQRAALDSVPPGPAARFDSLMSAAAGVDRRFEVSGCPRP